MLTKREFLGDMPANKKYLIRQAYWWVFTYPGERAGAVVEIRESVGHGTTPRVRRYSVMELEPHGYRVFRFAKPMKEWRPDEEKEYIVRYGKGVGSCTCKAYQHRSRCAHLDSLLSLTNRQPEVKAKGNPRPATPAADPSDYTPHEWEQRGKGFRCVACKMRSYDTILTDNHRDTYRCGSGRMAPAPDRPAAPAPDRKRTERERPGTAPERPATPRKRPAAGSGRSDDERPAAGRKRPRGG